MPCWQKALTNSYPEKRSLEANSLEANTSRLLSLCIVLFTANNCIIHIRCHLVHNRIHYSEHHEATLIRTYAAYAVSLEHLLLLQKERIQAEKKQARRELAVLQSRKNQFEKSLQDLYEKLIDGAIDKETYLSQKASNQAQMQELTEKMERLEKSSQTTTEQGGAFIEKYKEYTELETLTSDIANDVVKRVTVYKDGGIEIELALRDELEKLLTCLETVDAAS